MNEKQHDHEMRLLPFRRNRESCRSLIVGGTRLTRCINLYMSINAIKYLNIKEKTFDCKMWLLLITERENVVSLQF